MADTAFSAAHSYANRGWHVFPTRNKKPLTPNGFKDASLDPAVITGWWRQWPDAVPAVATGAISGIVVLDVDIKNGVNGFDTLDELGIATHPHTVTAHTESGGVHMVFEHPGHEVP